MYSPSLLAAFITKWELSGAAERANAQQFLDELCDLLDVERPHATSADEAMNAYVFEKSVPSPSGTTLRIDLYKRGCFVLETKQGVDRDTVDTFSAEAEDRKRNLKAGHGVRGTMAYAAAMEKAKNQAYQYARSLPKGEIVDGRPPFIIVVDVGHSIALYTDWSRMGGEYIPYPFSG